MEDSRCSLPSISKLLGLTHYGSTNGEPFPTSPMLLPGAQVASLRSEKARHEAAYDERKTSSYAELPLQRGMPSTPPPGAIMSIDNDNSALKKPNNPFPGTSDSGRLCGTTPQSDNGKARRTFVEAPIYTNTEAGGQQPSDSGANREVLSPRNPKSRLSAATTATLIDGEPWQHHHYLPRSREYPQNQDRYICQTCNKAFSRPSSLRIHSHIHTGEKPFRCPGAKCGKTFNVRSNMKRHNRSCVVPSLETTQQTSA